MNPNNLNLLISEAIQKQLLHKCAITDADYKNVMPKIATISRLAEIEHSIYAVYDMHKCNYLLLSKEQKKIFGDNGGNIDLEAHYKSIHPDDLQFVTETDAMVYRFFTELPGDKKKEFKLVYNFRTKTAEGFYKHFMHQSIVLEQDRNGKTWLSLLISHLLSEKTGRQNLQRRLINLTTGKLHLFNEIDDARFSTSLTKREVEILDYIARGYDSVNIADKLKISTNTVYNHRQNILRKTQTENTTQAVLYCKRLGVL